MIEMNRHPYSKKVPTVSVFLFVSVSTSFIGPARIQE
jgi:hypothetical protein